VEFYEKQKNEQEELANQMKKPRARKAVKKGFSRSFGESKIALFETVLNSAIFKPSIVPRRNIRSAFT